MSATKVRLTGEERRQTVLDAACRVFFASSYRGATTAEVAREAGISEPILYRHFGDKDGLYEALAERYVDENVNVPLALQQLAGALGSTVAA